MLASGASLLPYIQRCPQPLWQSRETPPETSQGGRTQRGKPTKGCVHGRMGWGWAGAGKAQLSLHPLDPGRGAGAWLLGRQSEEKLAYLLLPLGQAWGRGHLLPPQDWNLALGAQADTALPRSDRAGAQAQPKKEAAPRDSGLVALA